MEETTLPDASLPLAQRSFDDMGAPLHSVPFCVLDLETTGGSAASDAITEVGAAKFVGGEQVGTFQTLVNPGTEIPPFITVLTGITHAMVIEAPTIEEVYPAFVEFLSDAVIVGHNVRFDMSFLSGAALRLGYPRLDNPVIDTLGLARRLVRSELRNLKLSSLAAHFRSPVAPTHRAFDDALATAHVFHCLLERAGTVGVTALEDLLQLPTARGSASYRKITLADDLPRRPGVYFFIDQHGSIFYVGKAKNLRTRVRAYFYGDNRRTVTNMLNELRRVDYRVCETELEAAIAELRLIHAHRPRYNRRSKPPKSNHWLKVTDEEFPRLSVVRTLKPDGLAYLGPFRSRKSAEQVMNALWDAIPIRRCLNRPGSRSAPCAFAQLGVASCPCAGTADAAEYGHVVTTLLRGLDDRPELLLEPLRERMRAFAADQRYEEAGWLRDRYKALARSIDRRAAWRALQGAGRIVAQHRNGDSAAIDHGRFEASWRGLTPPLPHAVAVSGDALMEVPSSVLEAEEAHLIWSWLESDDVRIVDTTGVWQFPIRSPLLAA